MILLNPSTGKKSDKDFSLHNDCSLRTILVTLYKMYYAN